jgi:hypothetical protein
MKIPTQPIKDFLEKHRVGVLAIEMLDGSPHGATVHFANTNDPLVLIFKTNRKYMKSEALLGRDESRATFVIGFEEGGKPTFQIDGVVKMIEEGDPYVETYLSKFPEKKDKLGDPNSLYFILMPTWWRFTDWSRGSMEITLSE